MTLSHSRPGLGWRRLRGVRYTTPLMQGDPHPFFGIVVKRANAKASEWFERQAGALTPTLFPTAFAGSGRRLGDGVVHVEPEERQVLDGRGVVAAPEGWRLCDVGRAFLLLTVLQGVPPAEHAHFVADVFNKGDNREREAVLKCLSLLPEPEHFLATAIDACRSHVQSVFEAIACENPYPARYFPDNAFNQLVLKAFFTGVPVRRIVELPSRVTPELSRMARDYASERRAAGRPVPPDLESATLPE